MRLVFTRLVTPLNYIEVDYGQGFVTVQPVISGDEWYIPLDDDIDASSIRVRTSSEELDNFKMIKEYQIKDNDGNWVGGNANQTITFPLELVTYRDEDYYYLNCVMFPQDITETGEYVGVCGNDAIGPYFETFVVTRIESSGFFGRPAGGDVDTFFAKKIYENQ